jgi:glutamate carboxypeptidase
MSHNADSASAGSPVPVAEIAGAAGALAQPAIDLLTRLVEIETPSDHPATMGPAFELLTGALAEVGMGTRFRSGRESGGMLLARRTHGQAARHQLLIGHCDTVWPVGTLREMPVEQRDGRLFGPGTFDMKCGLTQGIFALRVLDELGVEPEVEPVFFINSDEEVGSRDSYPWLVRLARIADRCFVLEPALSPGGRLKTARKGVAQYEIRVRGRAAHAGLNPEQGVSAILELSHLVQELFALNDPDRGVSVNVGTIDGGLRPNVIAPESRATIDVRVPTHADAERIDTAIRGLRPSRPEISIEVSGTEGRAPLEPTPQGRRLWEAARRGAAELGLDLAEGRAGGGSDGNITNLYSPTLDGLGAVGDGAHASHEHVVLDAIPERIALLATLLLQPPVDRITATPGERRA